MIVCSCRNISDKDYHTYDDLIARLKSNDVRCSTCLNIDSIKRYKEKYGTLESNTEVRERQQ